MNNSPPGTYHFGPIQMRESKMRVAAVTIFQAGAQNLLMTLWPISDQTTVQIMLDFYEMAEKTKNPPKALADVQRDWLIKLRKERGLLAAVRLAGAFIMSSQGKQ